MWVIVSVLVFVILFLLELVYTVNDTVAPDGRITADKITELTAGQNFCRQVHTASISASDAFTFSVYVWLEGSGDGDGTVDLVITRDGAGAFESTAKEITLTSGLNRFEVTHTFANAQTGLAVTISRPDAGDATIINVWGAQLESGTFSTAYTKTTTAPITRNTDSYIANTVDLGTIGEPVNDIAGHIVLRPQFDGADDKGESRRFFHWIGPNNADQGIQIRFSDTNKAIFMQVIDETGTSESITVSTGPAYVRNDLLNIRWRKSSVGSRLWVDTVSGTNTNTIAQEDFNAGLNQLRLNGRRPTQASESYAKYAHYTLYTGADVPTDQELEDLTTAFVEITIGAGFVRDLAGDLVSDLVRDLVA